MYPGRDEIQAGGIDEQYRGLAKAAVAEQCGDPEGIPAKRSVAQSFGLVRAVAEKHERVFLGPARRVMVDQVD